MVDFPLPWEPLTTKKEGVLKAVRWGELMKSLMHSSSTGRAGAGSVLSSLCPAFLTALLWRESLENQHYDAPCAQQSPTSFNGLRRKSPCGLCSCMIAWKKEPAWRKLNLPHKDASAECRRKGTIHRFSQFVPNWLWYWRMLICKTKQESQRLTSINTWIWSKSFDIFEQQFGRVWTWTYT